MKTFAADCAARMWSSYTKSIKIGRSDVSVRPIIYSVPVAGNAGPIPAAFGVRGRVTPWTGCRSTARLNLTQCFKCLTI